MPRHSLASFSGAATPAWPPLDELDFVNGGSRGSSSAAAAARRPNALLPQYSAVVHERSAGYDSTAVGRGAMRGLIGLSTAANFLSMSKAQAAKLRQVVLVANLRAEEASNVLKYLEDHNGLNEKPAPGWPTPKIGQFAFGPGFGAGEPDASGGGEDDGGGLLGGLLGAAGSGLAGRKRKRRGGLSKSSSGGKGGLAAALAAGAAQASAEEPGVDLQAVNIKKALTEVLEMTHRAKYEAASLQKMLVESSDKANKALYQAAEELNYPGLPPESLVRPAPPARAGASRPSDLSPAWLDFLYTSRAPGADPYRGSGAKGVDPYRDLEDSNIFGSPPLPPFQVKVAMEGM